jgi:hypothetical protein
MEHATNGVHEAARLWSRCSKDCNGNEENQNWRRLST